MDVSAVRFGFVGLLIAPLSTVYAQTADNATPELLRQQERERALREQLEAPPQTRLPRTAQPLTERLPEEETPCFPITQIQLVGEEAKRFLWALAAADPVNDPATGRCLGTHGINTVMTRVQNAIIARGFVTTRILAAPQDLTTGTLVLTVVPGRIRQIRFTENISTLASAWNAVPTKRGDLLNLRDIEQALENFKRVPTVEADIQITPATGDNVQPGESDLVIAWQQRTPPLRFHASLDDAGSKTTGRLQGNATLSLDNLLTWNDLFYVHFNHDLFNSNRKGTRGYTTHYSLPYGYWTLATTISGYKYRQTVAGFNQNYVYSGTSDNAQLRLSRLIYRNATRKITLYGRGWARRSNYFIDDTQIQVQRRRTGGWELGLTHREYLGTSTLDTAYSAQETANMLHTLSGGAKSHVNLQNHTKDLVGRAIGRNPATHNTSNKSFERMRMLGPSKATVHSCYGSAIGECSDRQAQTKIIEAQKNGNK